MPRLRDLADQQLYRPAAGVGYGPLDPLFRSAVDAQLILEQWDPLVRLAASLLHRTAPAHVVLQRLAAGSRSDRLAKALSALGRLVKTHYILRYLQEEDLHRVQLQLNRGESRHQLARRLFFANQGAFRTRDYEEIMNKVSALSLLSNAVLVWNTVHMTRILDQLRDGGHHPQLDHLARISPLAHAHVIPNGTYHFRRASQGDLRADNSLP
jgi:TnpA family transposase